MDANQRESERRQPAKRTGQRGRAKTKDHGPKTKDLASRANGQSVQGKERTSEALPTVLIDGTNCGLKDVLHK